MQLVAVPCFGAPSKYADLRFACAVVLKDAETRKPAAKLYMHKLNAADVARTLLRYAKATECVSVPHQSLAQL